MFLSGHISAPKNNVKEFTKDIAGIFIGSLIYAIAVDIFIQPNHIAPGGFIGIAIILNHYFKILPIGLAVIVMNIPLLVIGLKRIGIKFFFGTIVGTDSFVLF